MVHHTLSWYLSNTLIVQLLWYRCTYATTAGTTSPELHPSTQKPDILVDIDVTLAELDNTTAGTSTINLPTETVEQTTKLYDPVDPRLCSYNFTGPSEDIFIIDRSASFSKASFDRAKQFVKDLIHKSFYLTNGYNHIAIFTFAGSATTVLDFVSGGSSIPPECELYLPGGLWEQLKYMDSDMYGENIQDALDRAWAAFQTSPRRDDLSVTKRLWLLTDFHEISTDLDTNRFSGVEFYGWSDGIHRNHNNFITVLGQNQAMCNYRTRTDWTEAKETFVVVNKTNMEWVVVTDTKLCTEECSHGCSCLNYKHDTTTDDIACLEEEDEGMSRTIIIAVSVSVVGFVLIIGVILAIFLYHRKRNKKSKPTLAPSISQIDMDDKGTNSKMVEDASTYTKPPTGKKSNDTFEVIDDTKTNNNTAPNAPKVLQGEHPYENGLVAEVLQGHGVIHSQTVKETPKDLQGDRSKTGVPRKLYQKNKAAKKVDVSNGRHDRGPDRQISTQSYMEPIGLKGSHVDKPYSQPYLEIIEGQYETPGGQTAKSPQSSHSYEQFTFPDTSGDSNKHSYQNTTTQDIVHPSPGTVSKMRHQYERETPISLPKATAGNKSPKKVLSESPTEKGYENISDSPRPVHSQPKSSSVKIGSHQFTALKNKFSQDKHSNSEGSSKTLALGVDNIHTQQTVSRDSEVIAKPFTEIM